MSARLPASWAKKGSKMRNKPVWECQECGMQGTPLPRQRKPECGNCGAKGSLIYHQSQKEYRRWCELKALEKAGQIRNLVRQFKYEFWFGNECLRTPKHRPLIYTADFVYEEFTAGIVPNSWPQVVEDAKGRKAGAAYDLYWLKRELMRLCHGIEVKEV